MFRPHLLRSSAMTALLPAVRRVARWISFETPIGIVPRLTIAFAAVAILAPTTFPSTAAP